MSEQNKTGLQPVTDVLAFKHRVIVAGTRQFQDYDLFKQELTDATDIHRSTGLDQVVYLGASGDNGPVTMLEKWCDEFAYPWIGFEADWTPDPSNPDVIDTTAAYKRCQVMVPQATHLVLFWDGTSRNSKSLLKLAIEHKLEVTVVLVKKESEDE